MGKTNTKSQVKKKDKSIEVVYSYKEVHNTAQNALEKYLSELSKKS